LAHLVAWALGLGFVGAIYGTLANSVLSAFTPQLRKQIEQYAGGLQLTVSGFLSYVFSVFVVAIGIFAIGQVAGARHEESSQRLETLLSLATGRVRWLAARMATTLAAIVAFSVLSGLCVWAGAVATGADVSLSDMLKAGVNCVPTAVFFLGLTLLLYGVMPRASIGVSYGLLALLYLWTLVGSLLHAPTWALNLTPFHYVGTVPIQPFPVTAACVLLALGIATGGVGVWQFRQRDLAYG